MSALEELGALPGPAPLGADPRDAPLGHPVALPDVRETSAALGAHPAELLDQVSERRLLGQEEEIDLSLEVLALRLGGYALDACDENADLGPGRGPLAHDTCLWLRKLDGLADGTREMPPPLQTALSALFWRLVDTTRGTALGEVDDVAWLGPFAAWWALVIDRPQMLVELATALPMMAKEALSTCCAEAAALRTTLDTADTEGSWGPAAKEALGRLRAEGHRARPGPRWLRPQPRRLRPRRRPRPTSTPSASRWCSAPSASMARSPTP